MTMRRLILALACASALECAKSLFGATGPKQTDPAPVVGSHRASEDLGENQIACGPGKDGAVGRKEKKRQPYPGSHDAHLR